MKMFVAALLLAASTSASAVTLIENNEYKEIFLSFDDNEKVALTVQGERYRGTRARTLISINEVAEGLFVVDQENLYYPAVVVYPPLPVRTLRDSATVVIEKGERWSVRLLVPANLEVVAQPYNPEGQICLAYWTGFVYESSTDSCVETGASGCSNPFEFTSLEACEIGNLLR